MREKPTYEELYEKLNTDSLTDAYSRRFIDDNFKSIIAAALEDSMPVHLALIDIDKFKGINDVLGHIAGDDILRDLTAAMKQNLVMSENDYLARYGGDEFILLSVGVDYTLFTDRVKNFVLYAGTYEFSHLSPPMKLSVSVGCTTVDSLREKGWTEFLNIADCKMYKAKKAGGNRTVY